MFASGDAQTERPAKMTKGRGDKGLSEEEMASVLEASGRYRVVRQIVNRPICAAPRAGFPLIGLLLDTETTGLNHRNHEVIEIGAIAFSYSEIGQFGDILGVFGELQQPTQPIPSEITALTGITDEMVSGKTIDLEMLRRFVAPADLIIAHNAGFDRPFCEGLSDAFRDKDWACSNQEVDWRQRGYEGSKLGYLLNQSGLFHNGHRAVDDCFALLEVLLIDKDNDSPFSELLVSSQRTLSRIWAEHSPFDMKDKLKGRKYRWSDGSDGRPKAWWTEVAGDTLDAELTWLRTEVYHRADAEPMVQEFTARDRYRS
jgi:DNA polymerase-3 subunit epsilon